MALGFEGTKEIISHSFQRRPEKQDSKSEGLAYIENIDLGACQMPICDYASYFPNGIYNSVYVPFICHADDLTVSYDF